MASHYPDRPYLNLMRDVRDNGVQKGDRTGTGTRSVFGRLMRFDLKNNNFPLLTSKKLFTRGIIVELLGFIKGITNNTWFTDQNVTIWSGWALKEDQTREHKLSGYERCKLLAKKFDMSTEEAVAWVARVEDEEVHGGDKLLEQEGIPKIEHRVIRKAGELGPIYGAQWRRWLCPDGRVIDQLAQLINDLKTRPNSRRHIITAWNPADLPDERISPQENVMQGRMALAACHCMAQFYTRPLTLVERCEIWEARGGDNRISKLYEEYEANLHTTTTGVEATERTDEVNAKVKVLLDEALIPTLGLSCMLTQRSADYVLGVPFNIASYALLTAMLAQVCDMVPDEFIWSGGDVHLYNNHFEQVDEQLSREADIRPGPKLFLSPFVRNIDDFTVNDFTVTEYDPLPSIKAPISV